MGEVAYAASATEQAVLGGHKRGETKSDVQPRVPVIGIDSGCIPGTAPGCSAQELERAGKDLVRSRMLNARKRLSQGR